MLNANNSLRNANLTLDHVNIRGLCSPSAELEARLALLGERPAIPTRMEETHLGEAVAITLSHYTLVGRKYRDRRGG